LASQVSPGADGLVFCPGPTRTDPDRQMGFYGNCEYESSIGHRARAVMEGVILDLYELYLRIQLHDVNEIMVGAGKGLQKSKIWPQITADIFGKPIRITNFENALYGAALMAAVGVGVLPDIDSGIRAIQYDRQVHPCSENSAQYQDEVINHWRLSVI